MVMIAAEPFIVCQFSGMDEQEQAEHTAQKAKSPRPASA
jgi:hypothetical protein